MNIPPQQFKNIFSLLGFIIARNFILPTDFEENFKLFRINFEKAKKIAYQSGKYTARCAAGYNPTEEPSDITAAPRTPAAGGRPSSVTVRAAPHRATFPKGKAMCSAQSTEFTIVRTAVTPAAIRSDLPRGAITRASQFRKIKNSFKEIKI